MGLPVLWKSIGDYEGLYSISNYGEVFSHITNKIMSPSIVNGYPSVELFKGKKSKRLYVHRLVAQAFIPNPSNKPQVNHMDENRGNSRADNLEWCTAKENMNYGNGACTRHKKINYKRIAEKMKISQRGSGNNNAKAVLQLDKNNNIINEFCTAHEASKILNISSGHIGEACNGNRKTAGGFRWKHKKEWSDDLSAFQF